MKSPIIKDKSEIPEDAIRVHLYNSKNVLMPRGSMQKESIGPYILERLKDGFESWTDDDYGDNPSIPDLIGFLYSNLMGEVENAWLLFIESIVSGLTKRDELLLKMSLMSTTKPEVDSLYVKWFFETIKSSPELFVDAIWFVDQYERNSPEFTYWTELHIHYYKNDEDYMKMHISATDGSSTLSKLFTESFKNK